MVPHTAAAVPEILVQHAVQYGVAQLYRVSLQSRCQKPVHQSTSLRQFDLIQFMLAKSRSISNWARTSMDVFTSHRHHNAHVVHNAENMYHSTKTDLYLVVFLAAVPFICTPDTCQPTKQKAQKRQKVGIKDCEFLPLCRPQGWLCSLTPNAVAERRRHTRKETWQRRGASTPKKTREGSKGALQKVVLCVGMVDP